MKQHERQTVTTFRWWRDDGKPIVASHLEILDEDAEQRIAEMTAKGYGSGELISDITTLLPGIEAYVHYSGWWVSGTKDNNS